VLSPLGDTPQTSAAKKAKEIEAPTLQTAWQEAKQTIEGQKREIATLKEWVDVLKEERQFLQDRLKEEILEAKKTKKKKKSQPKKAKKKVKKLRVKTPDDSICRYNMVLEKIKKEHISKSEAYARLGVDRNTIVYQAPIAELAAANPDLFNKLRSTFKRKDSLKSSVVSFKVYK
ncbi:hypothetical protein IRJ41_023091, partial [Triplophysa rosa]